MLLHELDQQMERTTEILVGARWAWLEVLGQGAKELKSSSISLGRNPKNDVILSHPFVSGIHASIEAKPNGAHELRDHGSKNGTFVEGRRLREPALLCHGNKITIGPFSMIYHAPGGAAHGDTTVWDPQIVKGDQKPGQLARIGLLSDRSVVGNALDVLLRNRDGMELAVVAPTQRELTICLQRHALDLVVANVATTAIDLIVLLQELSAMVPSPGLFVIGDHPHAVVLQRAFDAGAGGVGLANDDSDELLQCIQTCLTGGRALTRSVSRLVRPRTGATDVAKGPAKLSDRELAVFHHVGLGLQNRDIAARLGVSVKTVEAHKENIKVKLDLATTQALTELAIAWQAPGGSRQV